ncbi:MAG TPA: response regulator [Elusimicrobiota bacterium]|jgi:CheY-like chemotaxis protein|nr:response regulator [Elusimicrobiota bacterium]
MASILVVDDDPDVVNLLRILFEKTGYSVEEAMDGAQVLSRLGLEPPRPGAARPDAIVLDVMMPNVDGYTVARRLAEEDRTKGIPVVILTAKGQMRDLFSSCPNVAGYLEKPFDPAALQKMVAEAVRPKS